MGRRTGTESAMAVLAAFIEKRSWTQVELADRVGISVRALRTCLLDMERSGTFPVDRAEEPPHVRWTLPASWLPEGVALSRKQAKQAVRLLGRLGAEPQRDTLLEALLGPTALLHARGDAVPAATALSMVEDAIQQEVALRVRYASTTRADADEAWRTLSPQRVLHGEHPRFVAIERGKPGLRMFRVDRVVEARLDRDLPFESRDPGDVEAFVAGSIDGFHGDGPARRCVFTVQDPEARWVEGNLPVRGGRVERIAGGIRVEVETTGVVVLARFVVGLGGAARAEDEALRAEVERLARGALAAGAEGRRGRGAVEEETRDGGSRRPAGRRPNRSPLVGEAGSGSCGERPGGRRIEEGKG